MDPNQPQFTGVSHQNPASMPLFSRQKLHELMAASVPGSLHGGTNPAGMYGGPDRVDPAVEVALVKIAESFVAEVSKAAADLALHRKAKAILPKDVLFHLKTEYGMVFPGLPGMNSTEEDERKLSRLPSTTGAHQARTSHATRAAMASASGSNFPSVHRP